MGTAEADAGLTPGSPASAGSERGGVGLRRLAGERIGPSTGATGDGSRAATASAPTRSAGSAEPSGRRADPGDHVVAPGLEDDLRPVGQQPCRRPAGRVRVPAGTEAGGLGGGVDAAQLQHHRPHRREDHGEHHHEAADRERRLDGDRAGVGAGSGARDQNVLVSARCTIAVSAPMIESPVITV